MLDTFRAQVDVAPKISGLLLVVSIVVEGNSITIKHIIPTDDNGRLLARDNV